jgi:hypothetical protein
MTTSLDRLVLGFLVMAVLIVVAMLAQGVGESVGGGIKEWLVVR